MSIRGTAGYHLQGQNAGFNPGAGPPRSDATNDPSPLDTIREHTSKIEDWLDSLSEPVKPYMPAIGRFLIVVTFLEDALRILTQWSDQLVYLHDYRHSKFVPFEEMVGFGFSKDMERSAARSRERRTTPNMQTGERRPQ